MKQLNHLKTYESFTNEDFNPLNKDDWKSFGSSVRKGAGFLTAQEEIEMGKEMVFSHPNRKKAYETFLKENPNKAKKYLKFWGSHGTNATPFWDEREQDFVDRSRYTANTGHGGIDFNY